MLVADFVVLVAVAIVETGLAHAALHGAQGAGSILPQGRDGNEGSADGGFILVRQQPVPADQGRLPRRGRAGCQPPGGWRLHHQASG